MSAYETALRRYREAGTDAEREAAARVLERFAIDPYYKGPRGWVYGDPQSSPASLSAAITERKAA